MDTVEHHGEKISKELRDTITLRYKRITKAINSEFWGSDSDTAHSRYVGSYGRGTAIDTSDIDILVELCNLGSLNAIEWSLAIDSAYTECI